MAPRGVRQVLRASQPARLIGTGKRAAYRLVEPKAADRGDPKRFLPRVRGITKRLAQRVHSTGMLPMMARRAERRPGGHWSGPDGGRARGQRVDAQLTRIVNSSNAAKAMRKIEETKHVYGLTRVILNGLRTRGLEPVCAQRCVASRKHGLGTAADLVCYEPATNDLHIVELKCGHDHGRLAPAVDASDEASDGAPGCAMAMQEPLHQVADCVLHRHFAQLSATLAMFEQETDTLERLRQLGVAKVRGTLVYASDEKVDFYGLPKWWHKRGPKLLAALA